MTVSSVLFLNCLHFVVLNYLLFALSQFATNLLFKVYFSHSMLLFSSIILCCLQSSCCFSLLIHLFVQKIKKVILPCILLFLNTFLQVLFSELLQSIEKCFVFKKRIIILSMKLSFFLCKYWVKLVNY